LTLRKGHGAQSEIVEYADIVGELVKEKFPITTTAWELYRI
jgi:ATP:corrinoid adenosyltransferase